VEQQVRANPHRTLEKRKGIQVAEWLVGEKVDVVLVRKELDGKRNNRYAGAD
jgi:predicted Fe-Mo cluster-binding NifX family protein